MAVIAYNPAFAFLSNSKGKPIGHSAALLLSQFVWLSANRSNNEGWIECSYEEMLGWGFTRTEQETCRRILREADLIIERKGGGGVSTRFHLCGKAAMNTAENLHSEPETLRETRNDMPITAGKPQCSDEQHCGKAAMNTAENLHCSDDTVSIKDTNTLGESNPPISPLQGETTLRPKRVREPFVKPTLEQVTAYMTELGIPHKARKWMAHYEANGWLVGRNPMRDWKAACRTWIDDMGNSVRGSPPSQRTTVEDEEAAVLRIIKRRQGSG